MRCNQTGLGDCIEQAISLIGVTQERVERWVGKPCGCAERKERLNELGRWASRVLAGKIERAVYYLDSIIS